MAEQKATRNKRLNRGKLTFAGHQQALMRTHRSFGTFPHALLASARTTKDVEKLCYFSHVDRSAGRRLLRHFEMSTDSERGLPRGRDPQVLQCLLRVLFSKNVASNSVWFRKSDLLSALQWENNSENRATIDLAILRYFGAAYRGLSLKLTEEKDWVVERRREKVRRIITGYEWVDERKVRYQAEAADADEDSEHLYTRVVFDSEFINDLRGNEYAIYMDLNVLNVLGTTDTGARLYEILNYCAHEGTLEFDFEVKELAHERIGISRNIPSPAQCWQKIKLAFQRAQDVGYLEWFEYDKKGKHVRGLIGRRFVPPHPQPLPPLPQDVDRREVILKRFIALGVFPNPAQKMIRQLPEGLLSDAELVADLVGEVCAQKKKRNPEFVPGGYAYNQLKSLIDQREIPSELLGEASASSAGNGFDRAALSRKSRELKPVSVDAQSSELLKGVEPQLAELWTKLLEHFEATLDGQAVKSWLTPYHVLPVKIEGQIIYLQPLNKTVRDWVDKEFGRAITTGLWQLTDTDSGWHIEWMPVRETL